MSLVEQLMSDGDRWTALQFAFCNVVLLVLAGVCLVGLYSVYKMMYMFLTPLLWATLIGTILFPLKKKFNNAINGWLSRVEDDGTPLFLAVILIPYDTFISATDLFIYLARSEGIMILGAYLVLKVLNHVTFVTLLHFLGDLYQSADHIILFCTKTWISVLMMLYFAAFVGWLYVQDQHSVNKKLARLFSAPLWFYGIAKVSSFFGPFNVIVLIGISTALITITAGIWTWGSEVKTDPKNVGEKSEQKRNGNKEKTLDQELTGDFYLQSVVGLCVLEFAVRHDFVPVCMLFLAAFTALRRIGVTVGVQTGLTRFCCAIWNQLHEKAKQFVNVTVSGQLRNYFKFIFSSDKMIKNSLRRIVDDISTVLVMLLLIFGSIFIALLVAFQVHGEVTLLIRLGANLLAEQPDWILEYARTHTGNQLEKSDIDDYVEQGYLKGREWLTTNVRLFVGANDPAKGELLEQKMIELLDKLYEMWEDRNETDISSSDGDTKDWMSSLEVFTSITTLRGEAVEFVKANIDTIVSVAQSIWSFIAANISTMGTILFTMLAIVINFGLEIFNFFIEITVFLTALYYLLASSQEIWLPTKWMSDLMPLSHEGTGSYQSYIIQAIEKAISGVFILSAKMSLFYGLYTYFVHALFDINVVFIPSVLAAVFASIPVMAPCAVCVFGFLELYFAEHETAAAVLFVLTSVAPKVFADAAFYNELRGSHPYITGLTIIGGMYWLGLQGAIMGPILLCLMIVLWNVYTKFAYTEAHISFASH